MTKSFKILFLFTIFSLSFFAFGKTTYALYVNPNVIPYGVPKNIDISLDNPGIPQDAYDANVTFTGCLWPGGTGSNFTMNSADTECGFGWNTVYADYYFFYGGYPFGPYQEQGSVHFDGPPPDYTVVSTGGNNQNSAGGIQTIPIGYALTAIGYGSDDRDCTIGIQTAPLNPDGTINFAAKDGSWRFTGCVDGGASRAPKWLGAPAGHIAQGWTWGADTDGGSGNYPPYNDGSPANECMYQEYAPLSDVNNRSGWGAQYDGTCSEEGYSLSGLKAVARAPLGRVIVDIYFDLDDDAMLDSLAMTTRVPPVAPPVAPPPPTNLSVSCPAGTSVASSWDLPAGYTQSYFRAGNGWNNWSADASQLDGMNGSTASFTSTPGGLYHIWVHTYGSGGTPSDYVEANISCALTDLKVDTTSGPVNGPVYVTLGTPVNLTWTSANTTYCTVTSNNPSVVWNGVRNTSGSEFSPPVTSDTTFTMTCFGPDGYHADSLEVYISGTSVDLQVNGNNGPAYTSSGGNVALSWTSVNNTSCTASGGGWSGAKPVAGGELSPAVVVTGTTFTLNCSGPTGPSSDSVVVYIAATPTVDIKANSSDGPVPVGYGGQVLLSWTSTNSFSCTASGGIGGSTWPSAIPTRSTSGSEYSPAITPSTVTFTLYCTGPAGTANDSVTVNVAGPPTVDFLRANGSDNPIFIVAGNTVTLSWNATNADSCTASSNPANWSGSKASAGSEASATLTSATTFTLTCTGPGGSASKSITVNMYAVPTVDLKINGSDGPVYVPYNSSVSLSWTSTDASWCTAGNAWGGTKSTSGFETSVPITSASNFSLTCVGPAGNTDPPDSVTVYVAPDSATFVSQSVPTTMFVGYSYSVSVTYKNTGTNSWTKCAPAYGLSSISGYGWGQPSPIPYDNGGNCTNNIRVTPLNNNWTYSFTVVAPSAGTYNFQWQSNHSGVLFGDQTPNVSVFIPVPVVGICGTANKNYPQGATSYGSDTYCSSGNPSASPAFPSPGATVSWTCLGTNGGANSALCSAYVPPNTAPLNIIKNINQGGTVSAADGHISCGVTCSYDYIIGSTVVLTATPSSALWRFTGWSGACTGTSPTCSLPIGSSAQTVTANFAARPFDYQEF